MPDLDSGHYFLTTLAPIRDSGAGPHMHASHTQAVRVALAQIPPAIQSPATEKIGTGSPFARNTRTHLARMFVLNDVVYNGRDGKNALAASITGDDPAIPQQVDRLNTSYLVFCADIDAVTEDGEPLPHRLSDSERQAVREAYARKLWRTMEAELRSVYTHCEGFEAVETAQDFADYLERCHVETTMPFHDYYITPPAFHLLPVKALLAFVALPLVLALIGLGARLAGHMQVFGIDALLFGLLWLAGTGLAGFLAVKYAIWNGQKPLPPGRYDDLPSVLKALYLQQRFADFAVEMQGAEARDLHKAFGRFLTEQKPSDVRHPTQPPGVLTSTEVKS